MRNTYGVFVQDKAGARWWALSSTKRQALTTARRQRGIVGTVQASKGESFDAPTFRALMTVIADFRGVA